MNGISYLQLLRLAAPECILVLTVLAVLGADFFAGREAAARLRLRLSALIGLGGSLLAAGWLMAFSVQEQFGAGMLVAGPFTAIIKFALLVSLAAALLISMDADSIGHPAEYVSVMILGLIGMMFLVSTDDLLMVFISLELTSLTLYILAAFAKQDLSSVEAGLKYFLFGSISAAFTLFGFSLLYGISETTRLSEISAALQGPSIDPLALLAIVMAVAGFGFKIAAVPFHMWAPDVYQGAPLPSAVFIASGSKIAGFIVLAKLLLVGFHGAQGDAALGSFAPGWVSMISILAAFSMVVGNLAAIAQSSIRRLLAYSAIAHAGYALVGLLAQGEPGVASLSYYVITYALSVTGAFAVVAAATPLGGNDRIEGLAGLWTRSPLLAGCLMVFMLSLAGIPPLAGFFGKFYVFSAVLRAGQGNLAMFWLVVLALAMSSISLYYYLKVLKQVYVSPVPEGVAPLRAGPASLAVILCMAGLTLVLGCLPGVLVQPLLAGIRTSLLGVTP